MKKVNLRFRIPKELFAGMYRYLLPLCIFWSASGMLLILHGNSSSFNLLNPYPSPANVRLLFYLPELSSGILLAPIFIVALCRSHPFDPKHNIKNLSESQFPSIQSTVQVVGGKLRNMEALVYFATRICLQRYNDEIKPTLLNI